jgi:hypothetical protein
MLIKVIKTRVGMFKQVLPALMVLALVASVAFVNANAEPVDGVDYSEDIEIIETDPDDPYVSAPLVEGDEFSEFTKPVREMQINILRIESGWDSQTEGLPEPLADVENKEDYYYVQPLFKSGIIGIEGSVYTDKITIYLDDMSYQEAIEQKIYDGLTADEIASIPEGLLNFATPENDAHISELTDALDAVDEKSDQVQEFADEHLLLKDPEPIMFGVDAKTGTVEIELDKDAPQYQEAKFEQLEGEFVSVEGGETSFSAVAISFSSGTAHRILTAGNERNYNTSPFKGGAGIKRSDGVGCTSGFIVKGNGTGTWYSTTAAHCTEDPTTANYRNNIGFTSLQNTSSHGISAGADNRLKTNGWHYDVVRLKNSAYTPYIYTSGSTANKDNYTSTRKVTGAGDPSPGGIYCASGSYTGSNCTARLDSIVSTCLSDFGVSVCGLSVLNSTESVTSSSSTAAKEKAQLCTNGDSGGPVYTRNVSENRSNIKGTIVACSNNLNYGSSTGGSTVYVQMYSHIATFLTSTVVVAS